ncbi:MAG TPA: hypothetical protein VGV35_03640, partial [Bryobacteraceae bacterium]|nr:hypothetical protein [Bryobacteraceae bacterium]
MLKLTKMILCTLSATVLAASLLVADEAPKKAPTKSGGAVLHPEMTVADGAGTYDKPAGTLGEKPSEPWSATTIGAAVDKKAQPGKVVTVTGEIIDLSCYLQVGKHGEKHKACGTKCLQAGQPIGLLAKNGAVYMLMDEEHDPRRDGQTTLRQAAIDNFAKIMEVTGTETSFGGYKAIFVQG